MKLPAPARMKRTVSLLLSRREPPLQARRVPELVLLLRSADGERVVGHVLGHRGARGHVGAFAYSNGRRDLRIAADERVLADDGRVLHEAVVVAKDGAGAHVG